MGELLIQGLGQLERGAEGEALRGLLGMLVKKRTADADLLEISQEAVRKFLDRYTVGVTKDDVAGCYIIVVQQRKEERNGEGVGLCTGLSAP